MVRKTMSPNGDGAPDPIEDLRLASKLVEEAAYSLAIQVEPSRTARILLIASELEQLAEKIRVEQEL